MRISVFISMIAAIYVGENMNLVKNSVIRVFHKIFLLAFRLHFVFNKCTLGSIKHYRETYGFIQSSIIKVRLFFGGVQIQ